MADRDENGVDILDRFKAYKSRFMQWSVTEDVFNEVVKYIEQLRAERDEARRMVCEWHGGLRVQHPQDYAKRRGWDCFKKENGK